MPNWGQGAQGAAGGAMSGAAAGSAAGPWGAAVGGAAGGLIGGVAGLFGGNPQEEMRKKLLALSQGFGRMQAPQMGAAAQSAQSGLAGNRAGLIAQLEAQAAGNGPSAAQGQMREAMDRASASQASAAAGAGGRGVNAGAALRSATNNTAAVQAQGARDSSILRAQEQIAATQNLSGVIGQGMQTDNQLGMFNAGQQNDVGMANLSAQLQAMGITSQAQLQALIAAMGGAPGGTGTAIMAGGAQATPGLLEWATKQKKTA